jgi:hypothetical protein
VHQMRTSSLLSASEAAAARAEGRRGGIEGKLLTDQQGLCTSWGVRSVAGGLWDGLLSMGWLLSVGSAKVKLIQWRSSAAIRTRTSSLDSPDYWLWTPAWADAKKGLGSGEEGKGAR